MRSLTIQIPQFCPERWLDMQPDERGRFCANCQKTVVDYTALSDQELAKQLSQASETTCGRFRTQQLNRPLVLTKPKPVSIWRRWIGLIGLSVFGWQTARAQLNQPRKAGQPATMRQESVRSGYSVSVLPVHKADGSGKQRVITGRVLLRDSIDSLYPLPRVNVAVRRLGETWQTQTDSTGDFKLVMPLEIPVTELSVWTFLPGSGRIYEQVTVEAAPSVTEITVKDIILHEPIQLTEIRTGGYTIVRTPSRWQRIKRKLFH